MAETFINGYRKFGMCFALQTSFAKSYDKLKANYGDGFRSQTMMGADEGLRSWSMTYENLVDFNATYTLRGTDYGMVRYLTNLFHWSTTTGEPFVVLCPKTNQYYLAEFNETAQSFDRKLTNFYGAGIQLTQVRIPGVSVFSVENAGAARDYRSEFYSEDYVDNDTIAINWDSSHGGGLSVILGINGNPTFQTNEQNSKPIVHLDGTDDFLGNGAAVTVKEAFIVCKYRAATFANTAGLLTGVDNANFAPLVGTSGGTTFLNQSFPGFTYKYNGIEYAQSNMVAPMEVFGLVHIRCEDGFALDGLQIGKDRSFSGRFGTFDIGQIVICTSLLSDEMSTETAAHLMRIWNLG